MIHATKILSDFAYKLTYESLSAETIDVTKKFILDYYAASFAGLRVNTQFNEAVYDVITEMGGKEECDFIFSSIRLPVCNAAFLSACYAHGADMDDGNRKAMGHVGAHVISAVLTLAQTLDVNGKDVITAINVGYEVYNRVAAAVQPGLVHRGFHSTGTAGAIACGAACAKLMRLDAQGIYDAMALSAIQASGLIIIAESGQCCKPINPANAAKTGILSAKIVEKGIHSSLYPLESKKGYFHAMSDEVDESMITEGLGEKFTVCESYIKPYPSCRHTHCGIEAAVKIGKEIKNKAEIKSIKVFIYKNAIEIAGQIIHPKTNDDCKFSIHYALAAAIVEGCFGFAQLEKDKVNPLVHETVDKITLIEDSSMEIRDKGIRGCRVVVELESSEIFDETVLIPLGDAANPLTWEQMGQKLFDCANGILSDEQQKRLINAILNLDLTEKIYSINLYK